MQALTYDPATDRFSVAAQPARLATIPLAAIGDALKEMRASAPSARS
jgi:hypothetical protein